MQGSLSHTQAPADKDHAYVHDRIWYTHAFEKKTVLELGLDSQVMRPFLSSILLH